MGDVRGCQSVADSDNPIDAKSLTACVTVRLFLFLGVVEDETEVAYRVSGKRKAHPRLASRAVIVGDVGVNAGDD